MNEIMEIEQRALSIPEQAKTIQITNNETYAQAGDVLLKIKALRNEIAQAFDPIIEKAHQAHKEAISQKKKVEAPLTEAEFFLKPRISAYFDAQEQKRRAEEMRLQAEAKKADEDRRLAEAQVLESMGEAAAAEQVLSESANLPPVILPKMTPTVIGISSKQIWRFRIVDANKIPREYMMPDQVKIGGIARAMKGAVKIDGVEIYAENIIAAGNGRQ